MIPGFFRMKITLKIVWCSFIMIIWTMNYLKHKSRITTSCFLIVNHNVDTLGWVTVFPLHRRGVEGLPGGLDARPSPSWFIIILYFILILYLLTPHPNPLSTPPPVFPSNPLSIFLSPLFTFLSPLSALRTVGQGGYSCMDHYIYVLILCTRLICFL